MIKRKIIKLILIGVISLTVTGCKNSKSEDSKAIVVKRDTVEVNSEVMLFSLIEVSGDNELITEDKKIDTSSLGEVEVKIEYIESDETKEYTFSIMVEDTQKPTIEFVRELQTTVGTSIDLLDNVNVTDNSGEDIVVTIKGDYDFNKVGQYQLKYVVVDSSGNEAEASFVLKVNAKTGSSNNGNQNATTNGSIAFSKKSIEINAGACGTVDVKFSSVQLNRDLTYSRKNIIKDYLVAADSSNWTFELCSHNVGSTSITLSSKDGKIKDVINISVVVPSSYANEVLNLSNHERAKAGISALKQGNASLVEAASLRAKESAQKYEHTRPNGQEWSTVFSEFNISYRHSAENLYASPTTPAKAVEGWMNSEGHRANILNGNLTEVGIGVYFEDGVMYWSQLFRTP